MKENTYDDEISLKQLILTLIKNWKIIVACTVGVAFFGGLYVVVTSKPVYESKISGSIAIQESVPSKYGSYTFPTLNKSDYLLVAKSDLVLNDIIVELDLDVSAEKLSEDIKIDYSDKLSYFSFIASSDSPENAKILAEKLSEIFFRELKLLYKEKALNYFINSLTISVQSSDESVFRLQNSIENSQELLDTIEPTITIKKLVLSDPLYASIIAYEKNIKLEDLSEDMMMEEVINPNYEALQQEVIDLIKQLNEFYYAKERNERFLKELDEEKVRLLTYRHVGDESVLTDGFLDVIDSQLVMNTEASLPESPVSTNRIKSLAIALILGAMIGMFVAFFKAYWKNEFKQ